MAQSDTRQPQTPLPSPLIKPRRVGTSDALEFENNFEDDEVDAVAVDETLAKRKARKARLATFTSRKRKVYTPDPNRQSRSLLRFRRNECIRDISWSSNDPIDWSLIEDENHLYSHRKDCFKVLECWAYEGVSDVLEGKTMRHLDLSDTTRSIRSPAEWQDECHERLERWLRREGHYKALRPDGAGNLKGGFRLLMCDRLNMTPQMTMSRKGFEMVEKEFDLHDATLPAFFDNGGNYSTFRTGDESGKVKTIKIVLKMAQKVEISNCLLSLTHDVVTGWTDAFLCGDGIVSERYSDELYGKQEDQLLAATSWSRPDTWANPLLLPLTVLQICAARTMTRTRTIERRLVNMENHLGVTFAGWAGEGRDRPEWPMDVDVKRTARELHSVLPQILFMVSVTGWLSRCVCWLLDVEKELCEVATAAVEIRAYDEIRSTASFTSSSIEGMVEFFAMVKGRTQSQIDLLFSIVGQRDAIVSQKANDLSLEVARSTKEDSISMSTFTFITAFFLPPSFVATLFSMSMFNWSDGSGGNGGVKTLSSKFWIFWVVAVPLTGLTIGGWYLWYRHADRKWQRRLNDNIVCGNGIDSAIRKRGIVGPKANGDSYEMYDLVEGMGAKIRKNPQSRKSKSGGLTWRARVRRSEYIDDEV